MQDFIDLSLDSNYGLDFLLFDTVINFFTWCFEKSNFALNILRFLIRLPTSLLQVDITLYNMSIEQRQRRKLKCLTIEL